MTEGNDRQTRIIWRPEPDQGSEADVDDDTVR